MISLKLRLIFTFRFGYHLTWNSGVNKVLVQVGQDTQVKVKVEVKGKVQFQVKVENQVQVRYLMISKLKPCFS